MPELLDLSTRHCRVERDGHVVTLTMDRPEARNALSPDMLVGLADGYDYVDSEPEVRCAILTGAGGNFSSGADLKAMAKPSEDERVQARMSDSPGIHWKALLRDYRLSKPLIAAVEGYAVAGGTEMLQGTDIRIGAETATFGVWEARAGAVPARRLGGAAPPPDPLRAGDGHPPHRPGRERPRGAADRPHQPHRAGGAGAAGGATRRRRGRAERPALDDGHPAGVARGRGRARRGSDADPGRDRLGGLRQRGRPGGAARVRGEARARFQGK